MHKYPSIILARSFARLNLHPNYVTFATVPVNLIGTYFFFSNQLIYGALFYYIGAILDSCDGKLARLLGKASEFGGKLDYFTDIFNHFALYFGLWYSQFYLLGDWSLGLGIIMAHYGVQLYGHLMLPNGDYTYKTVFPKIYSYYCSFDESYLTFFFAPIFNVVQFVMPLMVALQFVSYTVLHDIKKEKLTFDLLKQKIRVILKIK